MHRFGTAVALMLIFVFGAVVLARTLASVLRSTSPRQQAIQTRPTRHVDPVRLLSPECRAVPDGPQQLMTDAKNAKPRAGEHYTQSPVVSFQILENGSVANPTIVRGCGIQDIDKRVVAAISRWKYRPRPNCGVVQARITVTIDFR